MFIGNSLGILFLFIIFLDRIPYRPNQNRYSLNKDYLINNDMHKNIFEWDTPTFDIMFIKNNQTKIEFYDDCVIRSFGTTVLKGIRNQDNFTLEQYQNFDILINYLKEYQIWWISQKSLRKNNTTMLFVGRQSSDELHRYLFELVNAIEIT
jgi:hypothetical protein